MRTIEPSTKGPDDSSGGGAAGGTELFFLLGTSDEGSLRTALLEARELGVDVFLLGVAILAVSLPGCGFRSHLPAAPARRRPTPARTARRATAREPAPAPAQSVYFFILFFSILGNFIFFKFFFISFLLVGG